MRPTAGPRSRSPTGRRRRRRPGTYLAAQIAVAVAETQQVDGLRIAALNRAIIGQAQGILMERFTIDPEQAFNVLRRVSQDNNIKLIGVADELVRTRRTPGA